MKRSVLGAVLFRIFFEAGFFAFLWCLFLGFLGLSFQVAAATAVAFHAFLGFASLLVSAVRTGVVYRHVEKVLGDGEKFLGGMSVRKNFS